MVGGLPSRSSRRVRRILAGGIAAAGAVDLLSAIVIPLRHRLHTIAEFLPLATARAAGALVAISGMALLALARGVRRGQKRAWLISVVLLALTFLFHAVRNAGFVAGGVSLVVLVLLLVYRREFHAPTDQPSLRSAAIALGIAAVAITTVTTLAVEFNVHVLHRHRASTGMSLPRAIEAVAGRLVGIQSVALPDRVNDFLSPVLLAVGVGLAVGLVILLTRPVVDRHFPLMPADEQRAREIIDIYGGGTLDYFALRDDKRRFFTRGSMVAYAVHSGVCLVSPDPIGPALERRAVWDEFRHFANRNGWSICVFAAGDDWMPIYRDTGMRGFYYGDEAVVDIDSFSLDGGRKKGLRQAFNRIARYGYRATFHDPANLDEEARSGVEAILDQSRRGEHERGFSMMLGRVGDPRDTDLLMCLVWGPDGRVAAVCQFVPATGIKGFSLDLMRRDTGQHPNGLIDFALCSTIHRLRELHYKGLSLNFAAFRSIMEGERGDTVTQRIERWGLQKLSGIVQIETLRTFNAKYEPEWLPRHIVFESPEHFVPAVMAIMTAESLFEFPVIGRMITAANRRRMSQRP